MHFEIEVSDTRFIWKMQICVTFKLTFIEFSYSNKCGPHCGARGCDPSQHGSPLDQVLGTRDPEIPA